MKAFTLAQGALTQHAVLGHSWKEGARRLLVYAAVVGLAFGLAGCRWGEASEVRPVQTTEVTRQNMRITAEATGQVEPVRKVEVKSKASGEVLRLHVDSGDEVQPGTLLAEIDPRDVQNAYDQAAADLEVAQARVEVSRAQLGRATQLLEAGIITEQEFESQNLDFANSRASLVRAQTNYELARLRLNDVRITAPSSGTILVRNVEEGTVIQSASTNVSGGTALFVLADLQEVQIRTLVDETDMGQIRPGMAASITVDAYPGRTFPGVVEKMEPQAVTQQNVTMFPVIVRLDNRAGLLKPGMSAEVATLLVERTNTLVVPNNAVVLPQEMAPAAAALGLDPSGLELDRTAYARMAQEAGLGSVQGMTGGRARGMAARTGVAAPSPEGQAPPAGQQRSEPGSAAGSPQEAGAAGAEAMAARRAMMDSLRARVERGEIPQDSLDAMRAALQGRPGGGQPGGSGEGTPGDGAFGAQVGLEEANPALTGMLNLSGNPRPAVAFVMRSDSTLEVRPVLMGVNDWDNAEILAGLEEGEQVALIGVAQLLAAQQAMLDRMSGRNLLQVPGMGPGMGRGR
jgi:HlyD family secretion protein